MIHPQDKRICPFDTKDGQNDKRNQTAGVAAARGSDFPMSEDFQKVEGGGLWSGQKEVGRRGIVTCSGEGQLVPQPTEARAQRGKSAGPDMEPGAGPSRASQDRMAESQQEARAQCIEGHGQVLLFGELWKRDECCLTLQDVLEQVPDDHSAGPSSTRGTSGHSSSGNCATRRPKRPCESLRSGADCPAAKSRRCAPKRPRDRCKAADPCESVKAPAPSETSRCEEAEEPEAGCWIPCPRPAPPERSARLLLVLCRASSLCSNLPRLQLLLQQVHARDRRPPAALVGIIVQPRPEEEAEARRRMETLLCSAFAPHSPSVEVHTAVFSPSRSDCTLDIQAAASRGHNARARGCVPLVDQETQTDGEGPRAGG